jgi:phenylalanyl-tRNA synthetase alpha chain
MKAQIEQTRIAIEDFAITDATSLEAFRIQFIGSKGSIKQLFGGRFHHTYLYR